MLTVNKKKIWKDRIVSLHDYEVAKAIEDGGCVVTVGKRKMTLLPPELTAKAFMCTNQKHMSKKPGWRNPLTGEASYKLIDFKWTPDGQ